MRRTIAPLLVSLALVGLFASCGSAGSPSPIKASPGVTTPATPKASPSGGYDYGY